MLVFHTQSNVTSTANIMDTKSVTAETSTKKADEANLKKNMQGILSASNENELVDIEETADIDTEDDVEKSTDINNPRVVSSAVTEEQQNKIDAYVSQVMNHFKGDEVLDSVMYEDDNGNPTSQVVIKKTEDGNYARITITYDSNGKITGAEAVKSHSEDFVSTIDGYTINFTYNSDGTVEVKPSDSWKLSDGNTVSVLTGKPKITIGQDGTLTQNSPFGTQKLPGVFMY